MGKKLIIKGADFSENGIFEMEYVKDSIPSESLAWHSPATGSAMIWANMSINNQSCYYPTIYGAEVKCNPSTYVKLYAVKEDGSFRFLQRFDIPASAVAGSWRMLILDSPATMAAGEYLGFVSSAVYYKESAGGTGFKISGATDSTGTGTASSTDSNAFPYHRIYDYVPA